MYHAVGTGNLSVVSNASVVVNEADVLVVDTGVSPAAAWALREEVKAITDKPIRYVVNTHYHVDHAHGNQIYGSDVSLIGHDVARQRLLAGDSMRGTSYSWLIDGIPANIARLQARLGQATPTDRPRIEHDLGVAQQFELAARSVRPAAPTTTFADSMTLHSGSREIRLIFLGRGHTGGDIVVFLPRERMVMTGDLQLSGLSYMGDGYPLEWADSLEKLKALDFTTILPGHGAAFTDKSRIDAFQSYLRDLWTNVKTLHDAGVGVEDAVKRLDMSAHNARYGGNAVPPVSPLATVQRIYTLLDAAGASRAAALASLRRK